MVSSRASARPTLRRSILCGDAPTDMPRSNDDPRLPGAVLRPLPARARFRTLPLSGRGNGFEAAKRVVAFVVDGVAKNDLVDHLLTEHPQWKPKRTEHYLAGVRTGLGLIEFGHTTVRATESGRMLQKTGDPDALRERLLTRLLGFDHLLVWMAEAPRPKRWLLHQLRWVNPGWTTNNFPRALLNWTRWLNLTTESTTNTFSLTRRGRDWRSEIHWEPQRLGSPNDDRDAPPTEVETPERNRDEAHSAGEVPASAASAPARQVARPTSTSTTPQRKQPPQVAAAPTGAAALTVGGALFPRVAAVEPVREPDGQVLEYMPQGDYANADGLQLNAHGRGPFCRFTVPRLPKAPGVYLVTVGDLIAYVGISLNVRQRWGPTGYARISPRNCFVGGQSTNCKVNHAILIEARAGSEIALWIHETAEPRSLEAELIRHLDPPWNAQA